MTEGTCLLVVETGDGSKKSHKLKRHFIQMRGSGQSGVKRYGESVGRRDRERGV